MVKTELEIQNLSRHCNEDMILAILHDGKRHGYQLALEIEEKSNDQFKFNHGTLYPILHKLEKEGKIKGAWIKDGSKRKRKQYSLTIRGKKYAAGQAAAWRVFFNRFFDIMGEVEK